MTSFYKLIKQFRPKQDDLKNLNWNWILYDQLSNKHKLIQNTVQDGLIFIESKAKPECRNYHKQKLVYVISSMRNFAIEKGKEGFKILYFYSEKDYSLALEELKKKYTLNQIKCLEPSEYEVYRSIQKLTFLKILDNDLYISNLEEFQSIFKNQKNFKLETFYRYMRKKHSILVKNGLPEGGEWNYDRLNREPFKKRDKIPKRIDFSLNAVTKEVIELVNSIYKNHFGNTNLFNYATTRQEALVALEFFCKHFLKEFGKYEDAMSIQEPNLFHSLLSPYLNNSLLSPMECIQKGIEYYEKKEVPLNSIEGFIRQILGWREYMRLVFISNRENYLQENFFKHTSKLPSFYWEGNSGMECLDQTIKQVIHTAYSHHITRLMVLSNFANLLGVNPKEINDWFWSMYIDAYEWVVVPNVMGMGTFADGGKISTKPYIASANYIQKMGTEFCKNCKYKPKEIFTEDACPFNSLYWDFIHRNKEYYSKQFRDYS
ncbi:MAG TPA: cryptochrome/photolyase family protein, partial [Leptospiraceae bacterium]|nr:cryptochrome/photolyase family protein [Leptospiraceae bacterium]